MICGACTRKIRPVTEPFCMKCGKPLSKEEAEYCTDCSRKPHVFEKGRAALEYDARMRVSIGRFKYKNRREYADYYVQELVKNCGSALRRWEPEALIPIPLHKSRQRKRGFNQAELVARGLGKKLGIPVVGDWMIRARKTKPQKELSDLERKQNLKNAFQLSRGDVRLKKVVLIDDIYTTGSTMDAAAELLLENGVEKVYFLSICIGRGY